MDIELGWVVGRQRVEQQCKGANAGYRELFGSQVSAVGSQVQVFRFGYRFGI